jgi:hypothetical protein
MSKTMDFDEERNNFFFELQCRTNSMALEHTTPITTHADKFSSQFF